MIWGLKKSSQKICHFHGKEEKLQRCHLKAHLLQKRDKASFDWNISAFPFLFHSKAAKSEKEKGDFYEAHYRYYTGLLL